MPFLPKTSIKLFPPLSNIKRFWSVSKKPSEKRFTLLLSIIDKVSPFLEQHLFLKYPRLSFLAAQIFRVGSNITYFFMHTLWGNHLLGWLFFWGLIMSTDSLISFFSQFKTAWQTANTAGLIEKSALIDRSITRLFLAFAVLLQLVVLNMFLVSIPSVRKDINSLFGEDFVKLQGYNSRVTAATTLADSGVSALKLVVNGAVLSVGIYCGRDVLLSYQKSVFESAENEAKRAFLERIKNLQTEEQILKAALEKFDPKAWGFLHPGMSIDLPTGASVIIGPNPPSVNLPAPPGELLELAKAKHSDKQLRKLVENMGGKVYDMITWGSRGQ